MADLMGPFALERPVKQLLVDLDGTLLGNRNIQLGLDFTRHALAFLKSYGGLRTILRTMLEINQEFNQPSQPGITNDNRVVAIFASRMNLTLEEGRRVLREGAMTIFPKMQRHFYPVEGAKHFLDWAKDRYPLILATNPVWPPEIVELRVKWAGIDPGIFKNITHIRTMSACKPSPEYYREILIQNNFEAEDCLLIGDGMKMDLPATRIGIRVFIVGRPFKKLTPLKFFGAKAPAWKGQYSHLRNLLEAAPMSSSSNPT